MAELKMDFTKMTEDFVKAVKEQGMFVSWWIPVEEGLPKDDESVLMCTSSGGMDVGYYHIDGTCYPAEYADLNETGWFNNNDDPVDDPVAWMPLPQSYKAGGQE